MRAKRMLAAGMAAAMVVGGVSGCGGSSGGANGSAEKAQATVADGEEGKIINLYTWNDEFKTYLNGYYPEVKEVSEDTSVTTLNDGTEIHWIVNPGEVYQQKLDEALSKQTEAEADDRVDLMLLEADYVLKYINAGTCIPVKDLGITDEDMAEQYQYTKDIVSGADGKIYGSSWEATPGLFAYRRSIAKDVLGTDDPDEVQEALSDWDKFDEVAAQAKDKGYYMLSGFPDAYRVFSNNVSGPWVEGTTVKVDPNIMKWIEQTKTYTDKGYNHGTRQLFSDNWNQDQGADGKVFGFFYSTWGINFTLVGNAGEEGFGDWAVCKGPQGYYWGGTWLAAANQTDNAEHIKDIMLALTTNKDIMKDITVGTQDYTNNIPAMEELAADPDFSSDFLGGQNHIALFAEVAPTIDMSNISPYDQGCAVDLQDAFADYFTGEIDFETAKSNFETAIMERYPELTGVEWE